MCHSFFSGWDFSGSGHGLVGLTIEGEAVGVLHAGVSAIRFMYHNERIKRSFSGKRVYTI